MQHKNKYNLKKNLSKLQKLGLGLSFIGLIWFYYCLPNPLFKDSYSLVVLDRNEKLLGAKIAEDGQWRFPKMDSIPLKFEQAIIAFEDKRFHNHIGIDPFAIGRATIQNIKAGEIKSGASTLNMQVIRLAGKNKKRNFYQKGIEAIKAIRLEMKYSKKEILALYASHAPYGGNVVGLEAASWRYYNKDPWKLSWAEAATLAVLPNAPSLIHPGRNRDQLRQKRNRLLKVLLERKVIDTLEYELALSEVVPQHPHRLPMFAPHLTEFIKQKHPSHHRINTTIDLRRQKEALDIADFHHTMNVQNDIHNIAILLMDTQKGEVLAYMGNAEKSSNENSVDMVRANRSSGSVLKPILYASMIDEGLLLPDALVHDTPTYIDGFNPKNYNRQYTGASPASDALAMSLNVPAVKMLREYGIDPFLNKLKETGITTIDKDADHYGLSLILGGAEVNLWELCGLYASMGRTLMTYTKKESQYDFTDFHPPVYEKQNQEAESLTFEPPVIGVASIYHTFEAMQKVMRPDEEGQWEQFASNRRLAWKTGTSFGHRDAWAIGVTPQYTIGVWVGNADGEGRPELVGVKKAGPVLFDILNRLPESNWFEIPYDDMVDVEICSKSGFLAGKYCGSKDSVLIASSGQRTDICPHHTLVHLDQEMAYQVNSSCYNASQMIHTPWFVLPPAVAHYYRVKHPDYKTLPPMKPDCREVNSTTKNSPIALIYPSEKTSIYLPKDLNGSQQKAIFKASHENPESILYWHLDKKYLGYTDKFHSMEILAQKGKHKLLLVDQWGNEVQREFEVVSR